MLRRIAPNEVRLGMFVESIDGNWLTNPFWRGQFLLTDVGDVDLLRKSAVEAVIIDESKGVSPAPAPFRAPPSRSGRRAAPGVVGTAAAPRQRPAPRDPDEVQAERTIRQCGRAVGHIFGDIRMGREIRFEQTLTVIETVMQSLDRNPKVLRTLIRMKSIDAYTYIHSLAVSVLMLEFGRHLKLDGKEVELLGVAGLLHDIGKTAIPKRILVKPGKLDETEIAVVRSHARRGHDILAARSTMPQPVLDVCLHHHERIDGTGYPESRTGADLSLHARMAAICDVYDAVTSVRRYKAAWSPVDALRQMRRWEGHFDEALLDAFIDCLGFRDEIEASAASSAAPGLPEQRFSLDFNENGYSDPTAGA